MLLERLYRFTHRFCPEWGSGGIFGLRYYRGVLYFTLAFDAKAYFISEEGERVYSFEKVGPAPRSGGDTYNAVATVDEYIYFGGWVHAPASYDQKMNTLLFVTKYSHVHRYDVEDDRVDLLWKDTIADRERWAGEVSEIIYDEVNGRLLLARADGHDHLGIYSLNPSGGEARLISERPGLKGSLFMECACFNVGQWMFTGFQCIDLTSGRISVLEADLSGGWSRDGGAVLFPVMGPMAPAYNRLFAFVRGGFFVGNPLAHEEDPVTFARLFDFPDTVVSPFRTNALPVGGGLLVAYNSIPDLMLGEYRPAVMPSVLVYVQPPQVRVVAALGARVTSLEKYGSKILVACNTMSNTGRPTPMDTGLREVLALDDAILQAPPPPLTIAFRGVKGDVWGGIPLTGYREARLVLYASKSNKLTIYEYDVSLPSIGRDADAYEIKEGKNVIDLSSYRSIVSFKLEEEDPEARVKIYLG